MSSRPAPPGGWPPPKGGWPPQRPNGRGPGAGPGGRPPSPQLQQRALAGLLFGLLSMFGLFAFSVLYLFVLFATLLIEHTGGPRLGGIGIG